MKRAKLRDWEVGQGEMLIFFYTMGKGHNVSGCEIWVRIVDTGW